MSVHICTECYEPVEHHSGTCHCDSCDGKEGFFPGLCCEGCDCRSFEEAHAAGEDGLRVQV